MIERFTDRATKAMALANQEAIRMNHTFIDSGHILLGILAGDKGVGTSILLNLDADLNRIRHDTESMLVHNAKDGLAIQASGAKVAIEYAIKEANSMEKSGQSLLSDEKSDEKSGKVRTVTTFR